MRTIAIVAGGNSSEYPISVGSAQAVATALKGKYETYIILIKGTEWFWEDPKGRIFKVDKNDFNLVLDNQRVRFDAAFIAIHGNPGENGLLQGYFDMTGIPYSSCDSFVSALTFNKQACKLYLHEYGIPMTGGLLIRKNQAYDADKILKQIGLPCFVKPNASGSSFGVSKVKEAVEFAAALDSAFAEGEEVLVESFMKGTEMACGVVKTRDRKIIMPVTEIVPKKEFFDYEAKYAGGLTDEITPARISSELTSQIQELSSEIYDILGCRGIVRVDYIITEEGAQFLEINTIPGMTEKSLIPQQAAVFGISQTDLYTMVIENLF